MNTYIELSLINLANFPIKEKKGMLSVEPDFVFDFYLSPKMYISDDLIKQLSPFLENNIELFDAAVELGKDDLRANYSQPYIINHYNLATDTINEDIHIFRSEDNSALFLSEALIAAINALPTDYVLYRHHQ